MFASINHISYPATITARNTYHPEEHKWRLQTPQTLLRFG